MAIDKLSQEKREVESDGGMIISKSMAITTEKYPIKVKGGQLRKALMTDLSNVREVKSWQKEAIPCNKAAPFLGAPRRSPR